MSSSPQSIVGIDLGYHAIKAVRLVKKGDQYALARVAMIPTGLDVNGTQPTEQALGQQIKEIGMLVKLSGAEVHFTVNSPNSTVRYVELPHIPIEDVRSALKINSSTYLRQNFENYTFDACPLDARKPSKDKKANQPIPAGKVKTLVGGISSQEVMLYFHSSRRAGVRPKSLQLAPISLMNCFESAHQDLFQTQAIALLDLGYFSSSLTILEKGKPILTRPVPIGGKHVTEYIAQVMGVDFAKAEAAKIKGEADLEEAVTRTCATLIREINSSINFYEKNSDLPISKIYVTGASVVAEAVIAALGKDIATPCEAWNATQGLLMELPPDQQAAFSQNPYAYSVALGVARTYARSNKPPAAAVAPVPAPEPAPAPPTAT